MNTTSIFIQQSLNFQFLSVCHYITIFGVYFYNKDLITLEERNKSISVLNTLFDYLNKSQNESEAKLQLLKKVLKGSDLYGGGENETLDMKYVDETYQYIISKALFSHYGNINGYLAKIINMADDINYSVLKEKVFQHLSENYTSREYCSNDIPLEKYSSKLNGLTIQKVFDDHIWQIFPRPEQEMSIMEVNYIYAMTGLKIIKSVSSTTPNLTFQEYILISRELDLQDLNNETYEMIKNLFSTPALFFYAYNQKAKFQKIDDFTNSEFWAKVYKNFFSYINSAMEKIVQENIENSLHNKIQLKMNKLKTRTLIAYELLFLICDYENIDQVSRLNVEFYKTFYLWITQFFLPKHCEKEKLPDLQTNYEYQFKEIEELYNKIERIAIEKILVDSKLIEKINLNSTVMFARVPDYQQGCSLCPPIPRKKNYDIFLLFAVKEEKTEFYALRQENNTLSLLINKGNEREFAKAIANDSSLKMEIAIFSKTLKFRNEDYRSFIARVADIKTKLFVDNLKMHYYEETVGEKLLNFAKTLIPFYSCIESAKAGRMAESAFSCSMDVLNLIPFAGWATEYTVKIANSLAVEIGNKYLITNTIARSGIISTLPIRAVLNEISTIAVRTIAQEILTKSFLTDLTVASLRTIDPGFESVYQILRFGLKGLRKLFQSIVSNFKKIPSFRNMVVSINSLLKNINKNLLIDHTVPLVLANKNGFSIVRYFYPGGRHFFGPTCLTSFGYTAELRSIEGYSLPIPVVQVKSPDGILYNQYIPETGSIINTKFKMDNNDILSRVGYLIDEMVIGGYDINVIRNYHVYHNTIELNKKPLEENPSVNLDQASDERGSQDWNLVQHQDLIQHQDFIHNQDLIQNQHLVQNQELFQHHELHQNQEIPQHQELIQHQDFIQNQDLIQNQHLVQNQELFQHHQLHQNQEIPQHQELIQNQNLIHHQELPHYQELHQHQELSMNHDLVRNQDLIQIQNLVHHQELYQNPVEENIAQQFTLNNYPQYPITEFQINLQGTVEGLNLPPMTNLEFTGTLRNNFPQISNDVLPSTSKRIGELKSDVLEDFNSKTLNGILNTGEQVPLVHDNFYKYNTYPSKIISQKVQELIVPSHSSSTSMLLNPNFYLNIIKEPNYSKYVDILKMWKNYGLATLKRDKEKLNFLYFTVNKLALLQLDARLPLKVPNELWYTKILKDQEVINYLKMIKGKVFFFNDITLLQNKAPGKLQSRKLKNAPLETEVRYHLKIDHSYGFVDLTKFHNDFENNYLTFNDIYFTMTNFYFTDNNRILNIQLNYQHVEKNEWKNLREKNLAILLENENIIETSRMMSISNAANFITETLPLSKMETLKNSLSNYILRKTTKYISSAPTYETFAINLGNPKFRYAYDFWKIENNPYIKDVLFNYNLDYKINLHQAQKKIYELYQFVHLENIEKTFEKYKTIFNVERHIRFEDYYALYSVIENTFLRNNDGIRRFEVAVNRLGLRQCDNEEFIMTPITLHRGELITREISEKIFKLFKNKNIFIFDNFKNFSPNRDIEFIHCLHNGDLEQQIPLLMEIKLKNQAGVVDVSRILNFSNTFHVVVAGLEFLIDDVKFETIFHQKIMIMKMHDYTSTERRMIQMSRKLEKLFSTNTKFFSDAV
ncbi:uncharacterized protein LOC127277437 isoform X2 [Leptopilina boulardi]|uniref:uncharacterized protein LOC127277437 isoform X2 n=1 Tax=Leptopilina boulardi TaxID=63433 RepID=UPI0021F59B6D|nr:uncharacterized protein LOC127277437 isoform X2 [Leptopilina boulardi]